LKIDFNKEALWKQLREGNVGWSRGRGDRGGGVRELLKSL
jgi:hypothetical protein